MNGPEADSVLRGWQERDELIIAALRTCDGRLTDFLPRLNGLSPPDAIARLRDLPLRSSREAGAKDRLLREALSKSGKIEPADQCSDLPLPHPLDFEWRFTRNTSQNLLARALDATRAGDTILFYGTPTVVLSAHASSADRKFVVLGTNDVIHATLDKLATSDARFQFDYGKDVMAHAAVIDPPWYIPAYTKMVHDCARRCALGAFIYTSLLGSGVRPKAGEEREFIKKNLRDAGIKLIEQKENELVYRTPLFELAAFEQTGVRAALPEWRRGDLVVLRKDEQKASEISRDGDGLASFELTIQGARLRVLAVSTPVSFTPSLQPICDGEVFPSISLRAPNRTAATLWTTTNRAFAVDPLLAVRSLCEIAADVGLPVNIGAAFRGLEMRLDATRFLTREIGNLIERELSDAQRLAGDITWLSTAKDARFLNGSLSTFLQAQAGLPG